MIVKKVIHEELGEELEKLGFKFVPGERLFWPYEREKDGVRQKIIIARDRYDKKAIKTMFCTSAYGQGMGREFGDFVPKEEMKDWNIWGIWGYEDEEGLCRILREFKRLIFAYGLDFLETISKPTTDAIPTEEKNRYLYEHHEELYKEYQEKLGTKGKKPEEVIEIIHAVMEKTLDEPFAEMEDTLVGIAALYGHIICRGDSGEWCWNEARKECMLDNILGTLVGAYILREVLLAWDYRRKHREKKEIEGLFILYNRVLRHYYIDHPEEKFTQEDKRRLYEHHEELYEEYQEKLGTKGKKPEEVIDIIYEAVGESLNIWLKDVTDTLLGFAALYGGTICDGGRGEWRWNQEDGECLITNIPGMQADENILNTIVFAWNTWRKNRKQRKEDNPLIQAYKRIAEADA